MYIKLVKLMAIYSLLILSLFNFLITNADSGISGNVSECSLQKRQSVGIGKYGFTRAYVEGIICVPSPDGDIRAPYGESEARVGSDSNIDWIGFGEVKYIERGCMGDKFYARAVVLVDDDGDGDYQMDSYAYAELISPPCNAY